jgi:Protein of unknown function (DUF4244)
MNAHTMAPPIAAQDGILRDSGPAGFAGDGPAADDHGLAEVLELFPGCEESAKQQGSSKGRGRIMGSELGMATAEYAIATLAAVGFAGVLVVLLRSEEVRSFLLNLIRTALALP